MSLSSVPKQYATPLPSGSYSTQAVSVIRGSSIFAQKIEFSLTNPCFLDFPVFFFLLFSFLFYALFLSFPRILGVPRRETFLLFGGQPWVFFSKRARVGGSV